ncbi:MAG: mannose-6-phosphate isomerase [Thermoplasmatales archaeon SG8-52-3]|nr:MAG: mannose-6-phosphate isomerase [Thermoplasmatales archaeon SG8-52-3]
MISIFDLKEKMNEVKGKHCSPIDIALVNDQVVRMSYIDGEFHWHKHTDQDELFYILKGKLVIQLKNQQDLTLSEGQIAVIPKGLEHCPKSVEPTYVLLFEPLSLKTRGD